MDDTFSMHEGEALKALLKKHRVKPADFARDMALSGPSGLHKTYFDKEELGDRAWGNVQRALAARGIDSSPIRPLPEIQLNRDKTASPTYLEIKTQFRRLEWSQEQLHALKLMLSASQPDRALLAEFVDGQIPPPKK